MQMELSGQGKVGGGLSVKKVSVLFKLHCLMILELLHYSLDKYIRLTVIIYLSLSSSNFDEEWLFLEQFQLNMGKFGQVF